MLIHYTYLKLKIIITYFLSCSKKTEVKESFNHGLYFWSKDDFMLMAQPNLDMSYTLTLFLPIINNTLGKKSKVRYTKTEAKSFLKKHFPDLAPYILFTEDDKGITISPLKTIKVNKYNYKRTLLLGDSAHTTTPFYGQGMSCSFEDINVLFQMLCENTQSKDLEHIFEEYSKERVLAGKSLIDLSNQNLSTLLSRIKDNKFQHAWEIEMILYQKYPKRFIPLYSAIAFTTKNYEKIIKTSRYHQEILNEIYKKFDLVSEKKQIIQVFEQELELV